MPLYDFKCESCERIEEKKIKLNDYNNEKYKQRCSLCGCMSHRMMDYKGTFELKGAGWFGVDGSGTGYEITQNEMDKTGDDNKFLEDKMT